MSTKRELHLSELNDVLQQMPVRGERESESWFDDMADIATWIQRQKVADLRGLVDLNGEDPEGMSRGMLITRLLKCKGL